MTKKTTYASRTLIALAVAAAFPLQFAYADEGQAQESAAPAAAAPAAKKTDGALETVIVTAQRRAENIKDVPMAIASVKGEKLDVLTSGGQDIRFLAGRSPSLNVESDFGRTFPRFYIRGLGNTDFDLNASQPVGYVMDDIVMENPMLKGFPVFDVDQVEVLRGPQGTLFGRNSPAGVIKLDSAKPVFKTEGYANVGFGKDSVRNIEGAFNVPLSDTVAMRFSGQTQHRDDRVHNGRPTGTQDFEGYDDSAARLQVLVKPTKDFSALFNVHARTMNGSATLFRANILKKGTNDLVDGFDYNSYPTDGVNEQWLRTRGANARLRWDLPGVTLHSITGFETLKLYSRADVDGGYGADFAKPSGPGFIPFPVETADLMPNHRQFSQEFRAESQIAGPLQWIAGAYYFNEGIQIDSISFNSLAPGNPQNPEYARQFQNTESYALFGTLNYTVSDALKLRGGLRYTKDKKDFLALRVENRTASHALNSDSSNLSWDLSGTYTVDKDTNVFARVATGYRAPSMQGRLFGLDSLPTMAGVEKAVSFEAGVKEDLFNRRARLSATVFHYRMKDKQLTAGSGSINQNVLVNADKVIGQGVEVDMQANLGYGFTGSFGSSYNDTEIKDPNLFVSPCGAPCTVTNPTATRNGSTVAFVNGNPLPRAPKWQHNFTLKYSTDLGDGELYAYTDWTYRSTYNMFLYSAKEYNAKALTEGGLRVGYKWDKYEIAAYGRNITNRIQSVAAIDFDNLTGIVNEPRTYGVQFKASF
ncbi:TonB-dependent receptor [Pseudoduganella ginsengisoli]|uniref:TonB-dependent receptor n=1 Tax=Pseudoduganella ginsengisoli TaxID=1462440 RepID=A0A6L6PWM3_9BURK|nr:TonB-dependent receptor [Pseudoduganella ginsengisoli]MTW01825.1 TonB-dependent receptor [Pseudoduganella ginsengisoli]